MTFRLRCASAGDHDSCRDGNQDGEHLSLLGPTTASTSCFSTCQRFNRSGRRPPGATGFRQGGARCPPRTGRSGAPPGPIVRHWSFSSRVTRVRAAGMSGCEVLHIQTLQLSVRSRSLSKTEEGTERPRVRSHTRSLPSQKNRRV